MKKKLTVARGGYSLIKKIFRLITTTASESLTSLRQLTTRNASDLKAFNNNSLLSSSIDMMRELANNKQSSSPSAFDYSAAVCSVESENDYNTNMYEVREFVYFSQNEWKIE